MMIAVRPAQVVTEPLPPLEQACTAASCAAEYVQPEGQNWLAAYASSEARDGEEGRGERRGGCERGGGKKLSERVDDMLRKGFAQRKKTHR